MIRHPYRRLPPAAVRNILTYCITLPGSERTRKAEDHFRSHGISPRMVSGVDGEAFGLSTKFPYEIDAPGSGHLMLPKHVGIWLSHWMVWQIAVHQTSEMVFILEDDAQFHEGWEIRIDAAVRNVPRDFDVLYVGNCCTAGKPMTQIAGEVWEVKHPMCFHAYIITRKAAARLLETQRKIYAPIDISVILHSYDEMKVYTVLPSVIGQFNMDLPQ